MPTTVESHQEFKAAFLKTMGARIRSARLRAGLTQREITKELGFSQASSAPALTHWESGRTMVPTYLLPQLADILGVTLDELMRG